MHLRRILLIALKVLGGLAALLVLGFIAFVLFVLPRQEIAGAKDPPPAFELRKELAIEKAGPGGVSYTVNNSTATFHLDVADPDRHCARLFPDYAAALGYCRANGLPTIPSVQLVQGKCKQFDDHLCAALETAVQEGVPGEERLGKRAALQGLLEKLLAGLAAAPEKHKPGLRRAVVYVATALTLGGARPELDRELAAEVERAAGEFLARPAARPIGFWSQSDALSGIFRQDRFLSEGLGLGTDLSLCVVLAAAVAGDPRLSEAFGRFREFDARLANPPVYVRPGPAPAPPERCVSCAELAALLPPGAKPGETLDDAAIAGIRIAVLRKGFGERAGFALVAYAQSKEYSLLYELLRTGGFSGREETMPLIIAAVRSGRLRLDPRPGSGWYDYQWHALETLLVPERAAEASKLHLTPAYRERLENAFKTALTKHRETQIKRLPVLTMGFSVEEQEPPKVEISPEFCVEPTATVYLRYARGYRFLRNSMRGVLGETLLRTVRVGAGGPDLDEELRRMALLCYGIYEQLCLDIGRRPDYLEAEMAEEDRAAARAAAAAWLSALAGDADLAADTRVAAPVTAWPRGPVRHWATGGVRLERVEYRYRDRPTVSRQVRPVFVPAFCYLPTDVFLEFERPGAAPLTREEFRAICDRSPDEGALRAALGAAPARRRGGSFPWALATALVLVAAAAALGWRLRGRLAALWAKRPRRLFLKTALAAVGLVLLFALALAVFPRLRTRLLVKYVARINTPIALTVETRLSDASLSEIDQLADLLSDRDPQVRYLAARFLRVAWSSRYSDAEKPAQILGMRARIEAAAKDDVVEVAEEALWMLGWFQEAADVDFLLARLEQVRGVDSLCASALFALGRTASPRALEAVLPFTGDARRLVHRVAISALGEYQDERAARRLAELVQSENERDSSDAAYAIGRSLYRNPGFKEIYDPALLAAARVAAFKSDHRMRLVGEIKDPLMKVEACLAIFRQPSASRSTSAEECRKEAARVLAGLCPGKGVTVERLAELTRGPDVDLAAVAAALLKKD